MTVTIRAATSADAAELAQVAALTFGLACPPSTTEAAKADFIATVLSQSSFDAYLADPQRDVVVAVADGRILGYTILVYGDPADPDVASALSIRPSAELSKCYVLADHHHSGVAAELMSASLAAAAGRGCEASWLGVNEENARAQRFYAKHGFERVGSKRFRLGDRFESDWVMERRL